MLFYYLHIILFSLFGNFTVIDSDRVLFQENNSITPDVVFEKIINGIANGEVSEFSDYFSSQVYLSLNSGEKGYYSKNQVFYSLQSYFHIYKPNNFKVTSKLMNSSNPYFAGKFMFNQRGKKGTVQVYIGLSLVDNRWEITQITFN